MDIAQIQSGPNCWSSSTDKSFVNFWISRGEIFDSISNLSNVRLTTSITSSYDTNPCSISRGSNSESTLPKLYQVGTTFSTQEILTRYHEVIKFSKSKRTHAFCFLQPSFTSQLGLLDCDKIILLLRAHKSDCALIFFFERFSNATATEKWRHQRPRLVSQKILFHEPVRCSCYLDLNTSK